MRRSRSRLRFRQLARGCRFDQVCAPAPAFHVAATCRASAPVASDIAPRVGSPAADAKASGSVPSAASHWWSRHPHRVSRPVPACSLSHARSCLAGSSCVFAAPGAADLLGRAVEVLLIPSRDGGQRADRIVDQVLGASECGFAGLCRRLLEPSVSCIALSRAMAAILADQPPQSCVAGRDERATVATRPYSGSDRGIVVTVGPSA